jgi:hypothetical protein
MLRDAPYLYRLAAVSADDAERKTMLAEFDRLRLMLRRARIHGNCYKDGCAKRAKWMTLPIDQAGRYWASPHYWCNDHGPWGESGISDKLPVHFDVIKQFRYDKSGQKDIFRQVREALRIKKGTRITEEMANCFFADLSQ